MGAEDKVFIVFDFVSLVFFLPKLTLISTYAYFYRYRLTFISV